MKKVSIAVLSVICTIGLCFIIVGGITLYNALHKTSFKNKSTEEFAYNPEENTVKNIDGNSQSKDDVLNENNIKETKGSLLKKKILNLSDFISNLQCKEYILQKGETLCVIARKFENKCNLNSTIELITLKNNLSSPNKLNAGTHLLIPEDAINNGNLYKVAKGDTWYKIVKNYYPEYDVNSIMNLVVKINQLPSNELPLDENIFLPAV